MQRVEQPAQEVHRVRLRADLVTVVRLVRDRLQALVRCGGDIGEIQARWGEIYGRDRGDMCTPAGARAARYRRDVGEI